jgi:hypothetical protein
LKVVAPIATLPSSGRRILRVEEERQDEATLLLRDEGREGVCIRRTMGSMEGCARGDGRDLYDPTTTPNALLADLHDRMPAILRPDAYEVWLSPKAGDAAALKVLKPYDASLIRRYPVSTRVNHVQMTTRSALGPWRWKAHRRRGCSRLRVAPTSKLPAVAPRRLLYEVRTGVDFCPWTKVFPQCGQPMCGESRRSCWLGGIAAPLRAGCVQQFENLFQINPAARHWALTSLFPSHDCTPLLRR